MRASASCQNTGVSRKLMKPGPATSTAATPSWVLRRAANKAAISRGNILARLARTMAALVATSPSAASRGGSTVTRPRSSPAGTTPFSAKCANPASIIPSIYLKTFIKFSPTPGTIRDARRARNGRSSRQCNRPPPAPAGFHPPTHPAHPAPHPPPHWLLP